MPTRVSKAEFRWREWVLGRGPWKGKGPKSKPRPNFGYGGPGQPPVPDAWWQRFEDFLTRGHDHAEVPGKPPVPKPDHTPARPGQLTAHFRVEEFNCKDGTHVPKVAIPALDRLATRYLEPLRKKFGPCQVMSGYRHRAYNRRIGGARFSQHIYDDSPSSVAADLIFARGTPRQWAALVDKLGAGGVGTYPGFVHVDNRPGRARWTG